MDINELYTLSRRHLQASNYSYQRSFLQEERLKHRLSIIIGQRGVGKTTIIIQHLLNCVNQNLESKEILYIPTDHFLLGNSSLSEIAEAFYKQGGKIIAFDEIHKYSRWSMELKSIYDTYPQLHMIASGSSALEIHNGSHDLTRRAAIYRIHGLSFREYLELHLSIKLPKPSLEDIIANHESLSPSIVHDIEQTGHKILPLFKDYLSYGYYPYSLDINDHHIYLKTLEENFHATIEIDLAAVYSSLTGSSIRKLKQLLRFIAQSVPFSPNMKKLKTLLEIGDERTLKTYLKYLSDAGLIHLVMKASNKIKQIETPEKIYLNNTNQLHAISQTLENSDTPRELFFLSMLSPQHTLTAPKQGDFLIDGKWVVEIGGKKKTKEQIEELDNAFLACDNLEHGANQKIPLWLFGFVY